MPLARRGGPPQRDARLLDRLPRRLEVEVVEDVDVTRRFARRREGAVGDARVSRARIGQRLSDAGDVEARDLDGAMVDEQIEVGRGQSRHRAVAAIERDRVDEHAMHLDTLRDRLDRRSVLRR